MGFTINFHVTGEPVFVYNIPNTVEIARKSYSSAGALDKC